MGSLVLTWFLNHLQHQSAFLSLQGQSPQRQDCSLPMKRLVQVPNQVKGSHLQLKKDGTTQRQHLSKLAVPKRFNGYLTMSSGTPPRSVQRLLRWQMVLLQTLKFEFSQSNSPTGTETCRQLHLGGFGARKPLGNRPGNYFWQFLVSSPFPCSQNGLSERFME